MKVAKSLFLIAAVMALAACSTSARYGLAKAKGDGLRAAQDSLDIRMVPVGEFAKKLLRYAQVVREFTEAQLKQLSASMPQKPAEATAAITKIEAQIKAWDATALIGKVDKRSYGVG